MYQISDNKNKHKYTLSVQTAIGNKGPWKNKKKKRKLGFIQVPLYLFLLKLLQFFWTNKKGSRLTQM